MSTAADAPAGGIAFERPALFWAGVAAVTVGVALHLPMFVHSADMGYRMAGMAADTPMIVGMVLIIGGLLATGAGLLPRRRPAEHAGEVRVRVHDDARLSPAHVALLLVMAAAVTIDVMKPVTLGFVAPGMAKEYGLKSALNPGGDLPVALLPLAGITGTVIGSLTWGWLGDRMGRRPTILFASVLFIGTAICGTMPSFTLNLVMCFVMGLGVGGMLPIAFALLAETVPARSRGWLLVLIGGDVAGAYFLTSWLASALTPEYGWRALWLIGLPTGVLLVLLNRWIPESPRFLLARGRTREAQAVMARYGAHADVEPVAPAAATAPAPAARRTTPAGLTAAVALLAAGVGLVTFGFQLWMPSNLQAIGLSEVTADRILRDSSLLGLPATFLIAWLYGFWSSRGTIVLLAAVTAASLVGFAVVGDAVADDRTLLYVMLAVPITAVSSLLAALTAYSTEVHRTTERSRGAGVIAAASKAGGVLIIALVVVAVAPPSIAGTAIIGAIPLVLGAGAIALLGVETRRRSLEDITTGALTPAAEPR